MFKNVKIKQSNKIKYKNDIAYVFLVEEFFPLEIKSKFKSNNIVKIVFNYIKYKFKFYQKHMINKVLK